AVLRMDDRGMIGTNGNYKQSTTMDFAKDMLAAVTWLNNRNDIDPNRIGFIGHSEGGIIAPMAYVLEPSRIHFMVIISPPVIGLRAINRYQTREELEDAWKSDT